MPKAWFPQWMHDEILWRGVIFAFVLVFGFFCTAMTVMLYTLRSEIETNRHVACTIAAEHVPVMSVEECKHPVVP